MRGTLVGVLLLIALIWVADGFHLLPVTPRIVSKKVGVQTRETPTMSTYDLVQYGLGNTKEFRGTGVWSFIEMKKDETKNDQVDEKNEINEIEDHAQGGNISKEKKQKKGRPSNADETRMTVYSYNIDKQT